MQDASVLFVCLGNICRSPTAHGVFKALVEREGLEHVISIDSAGTSGWHIGDSPDARTASAAKSRGYDLSDLRGRQVCAEDFEDFDYILAMDHDNLSELERMKPKNYSGHLALFLSFAPDSTYEEVPDPYYGGTKGFTLVLDLVESASKGLLEHIKKTNA